MLKKLLLLITLFVPKSTLSSQYDYETYVLDADSSKSFELPNQIKSLALNANGYLNMSPLFDTRLIVDSVKVQKEFAKDPSHSEVIIETEDGQKLSCSYFNRNKNKIVIVGPGFTNGKEKIAPFAHIFNNYDVLLLNFRGHGLLKGFQTSLTYNALGVTQEAKLGCIEEKDVFAAIKFANDKKRYKSVIGLGICYGAFIIAKAQAIAQANNLPAFDKIVLDGCWTSLNEFARKVKCDPQIINDPQRGGASCEVKYIFSKEIVSASIINWVERYLKINFNDADLTKIIGQIKCPALFFYGKNDLTIERNQFEALWSLTTANKLGIITSNPHVRNHLQSKEIYKLVAELFIEHDIETVKRMLSKPELLMGELTKKFKADLEAAPLCYVPKKFDKPKQSTLSKVMSYKFPALFFTTLYTCVKHDKVSANAAKSITALYGVYKTIELGWRPAIRLAMKYNL